MFSITGISESVLGMCVGEIREAVIPPDSRFDHVI